MPSWLSVPLVGIEHRTPSIAREEQSMRLTRRLVAVIAVVLASLAAFAGPAQAGTTTPNCGLIQGPNPAWQADVCTWLTHDAVTHSWQGNSKMSGTRNGTSAVLQIVTTTLYTDGVQHTPVPGPSRQVPPTTVFSNATSFIGCSGFVDVEAKTHYKVFWPNGDVTDRLQTSGLILGTC
jgi:hypothetical protein